MAAQQLNDVESLRKALAEETKKREEAEAKLAAPVSKSLPEMLRSPETVYATCITSTSPKVSLNLG